MKQIELLNEKKMEDHYLTHYLECFQASGKVKKRYFQECYIVKYMDNRKVLVRALSKRTGLLETRYVYPEKLTPIYEPIKDNSVSLTSQISEVEKAPSETVLGRNTSTAPKGCPEGTPKEHVIRENDRLSGTATAEEIMMKHCSDNGLFNLNMGKQILKAMHEFASKAPVREKKPTDHDIENAAEEYEQEHGSRPGIDSVKLYAYIAGAKDMRDGNIYISPQNNIKTR